MKRIVFILLIAVCAFVSCSKESGGDPGEYHPGYIRPFPYNKEEEELSKQIQGPSFPVLNEGYIISWRSSYDHVLEAISQNEGYTIKEYYSETNNRKEISVSVSETYWWAFYFDADDLTRPRSMLIGRDLYDKIDKPYAAKKEKDGYETFFYLYGNTIVENATRYGSVFYNPRSYDFISKAKLN